MTNQVSVSRAKGSEKSNPMTTPEIVLNKTEDFSNIVVMSGTAKRKPLGKKENRYVGTTPKTDFKGGLSKLRVPFSKPHQKHAPMEERLMTKSCEVLFECIKPYKDIRVGKKSQAKQSVQTIGSILTTDVIWERRAVRKVQFFSFSQENSSISNSPLQILTPELDTEKLEIDNWGLQEILSAGGSQQLPTRSKAPTTQTIKTISSEDFITNAFPEPSPI